MLNFAHKTRHLNVGLYSFGDVAKLLKVDLSCIRRLANPKEGVFPGRSIDPDEHALTFAELMEIQIVAMYWKEGVSLGAVRVVSNAAAERFGTPYPLSAKRFDAEGKAIFAALLSESANRKDAEDLNRGQIVFDSVVRPFFRKLDYDPAEEIVRYWPCGKRGHVVLDPKRKFGKPIDPKSGVPTQVIYNALQAGSGQSTPVVARWLGISEAAVSAAAEFEQSLLP